MSIDLSLDRIRKLQALLPPYTRPTCHITGTNGKGSISAFLSSIFLAASPSPTFLVGRFNSPHLVSVRDSITLNYKPVSADIYDVARSHVEKTNTAHGIGASNFELLTCTALYIFETSRADIVIAEVGMGGRLDATNVIPNETVLVSAMSAVDLDHQAFLGGTISAIAREKAAIARPGKPFVLGQQTHSVVECVVREVVGHVGGEVVPAPAVSIREWDENDDGSRPPPSASFTPPPPQPVEARLVCFPKPVRALLPLHGAHQLVNLGTALGVISALLTHSFHDDVLPWRNHITPDAVARGIKNTIWPGRLSFHRLPGHDGYVLVDGAHNPASAHTLAAFIAQFAHGQRPLVLTYLLALSHSPPKTPLQTLAPLLSPSADIGVALLSFTPPDGMPWVKSEPSSTLRAAVSELVPDAEIWVPDEDNESHQPPLEQLRAALQWAAERHKRLRTEGLIVVAGSLYLVADFYRLAGQQRR